MRKKEIVDVSTVTVTQLQNFFGNWVTRPDLVT